MAAKKLSTTFGLLGVVIGVLAILTYFTPVSVGAIGLPLSAIGVALGICACVVKPRNWWLALLALILSVLPLAYVATARTLGIKC